MTPRRPSGPWRTLIPLGVVAAATASAWIVVGRPAPHKAPPDVVLVTVDTLRADHLAAYGYPRTTAPFLEMLGRRGTVFTRAMAASATTAPSHASMMTGLFPSQHGVLTNGLRLKPGVRTLAQRLATAGYRTLGVTSVPDLFSRAGLDRGFEVFPNAGRRLLPGPETVDAAIQALSAVAADRPLFAWLHLYEPHTPYDPPQPYREPSEASAKAHLEFLRARQGIDVAYFDNDPSILAAIVDRYDGEIRAADAEILRFFRAIRDRRAGRRLVSIVTSDHGEGLGNHGWLLHGKYLYEEQVHVPLIINDSEDDDPPGRLAGLVEHVDLFATILELAGVAPLDVRLETRAASLVGALRGSGFEGKEVALSERRAYDPAEHRRALEELRESPASPALLLGGTPGSPSLSAFASRLMTRELAENYEAGRATAIRGVAHKLIIRDSGDTEVFDLVSDPFERHDLRGRRPSLERYYRERPEFALVTAWHRSPLGLEPLDDETRRGLRALGYLQ